MVRSMRTGDVLIGVRDGLARITLNRPRALNALTHDMVRTIDAALTEWESDDTVRTVVITGAGERGLCAGGDIRSIYEDASAGGAASLRFWADEYKLNAHIARYAKPYVALMDGVVMGGGVGVSSHGSVRVVTERSRVAMLEVGIGLAPDVGGTYLLSRAPGQLGTHMALTAAQLTAGDAIHCGLADHYVPAARLPRLLELLAQQDAGDAVRAVAELPADRPLSRQADWIDSCYAADTVEEILERLRASGEQGSGTAKEIESKSPTAVKVTLRALRSAADLPDLEAVLAQEYRVSAACLRGHDLIEGIRAQIIDKDRDPRWSPSTLAEVSDDMVAAHFAQVR